MPLGRKQVIYLAPTRCAPDICISHSHPYQYVNGRKVTLMKGLETSARGPVTGAPRRTFFQVFLPTNIRVKVERKSDDIIRKKKKEYRKHLRSSRLTYFHDKIENDCAKCAIFGQIATFLTKATFFKKASLRCFFYFFITLF